jgi:hypothetical protein
VKAAEIADSIGDDSITEVWDALTKAVDWRIGGTISLEDKRVKIVCGANTETVREGSTEVVLYVEKDSEGNFIPYCPLENWRHPRCKEVWLNASRKELSGRKTVTQEICETLACVFIDTFGAQDHILNHYGIPGWKPSLDVLEKSVGDMNMLLYLDKQVYAASHGYTAACLAFGKDRVVRVIHPSRLIEKTYRCSCETARILHIIQQSKFLTTIANANKQRYIRRGKAGGAVTGAQRKVDPELGLSRTGVMWAAQDKKKEENPEVYKKDRARGGHNRTISRYSKLLDNEYIVELPQTCKNRRIICACCFFVANQTSLWNPHVKLAIHTDKVKSSREHGLTVDNLIKTVQSGNKFKALSDVATRSRGTRDKKPRPEQEIAQNEFLEIKEESLASSSSSPIVTESRYYCFLCKYTVGRSAATRGQWTGHIRGALHLSHKKKFDEDPRDEQIKLDELRSLPRL